MKNQHFELEFLNQIYIVEVQADLVWVNNLPEVGEDLDDFTNELMLAIKRTGDARWYLVPTWTALPDNEYVIRRTFEPSLS